MRDFRPYIKAQGWTLRSVWQKSGITDEGNFHNYISGKTALSRETAEKIEAATDGLLPVGFLMGIKPFAEPAQPSTSSEPAA